MPLGDIKNLEKKYNAKIFDNSIEIETTDGKMLFFTSFIYRDEAFDILKK